MGRMGFIMMRPFHGLSNKHSRQVCKDEGLDKGDQYLDHIYEYRKGNGYGCKTPTNTFTHIRENENQGNKTNDDDVTGQHIGKKPYDQGGGFGKDRSYEFNQGDDGFHGAGNRRIENMSPIMFVTAKQDHDQ